MDSIFTANINSVLEKHFGKHANDIFDSSQLIQYINKKTRSANKGSKSRSSFANLYAIYVIVEDYIANGFESNGGYLEYKGAHFKNLFNRQRELPFGSKLQNHALNNRMNSEFQKFFPNSNFIPILRNQETNRYWINENLLKIKIGKTNYNIANAIINIIDEYAKIKQDAFQRFLKTCELLQKIDKKSPQKVEDFILSLLETNVDARLFEIVSFSILKYFYQNQRIFWGFKIDNLIKENLILFKTGRTNANDGGIDFVMKPLGRFFQVTETLDFKKYFLDIDKIQKYPITFIIKSSDPIEQLIKKIKNDALKNYSIQAVVNTYMDCIEEIINIPTLRTRFNELVKKGFLKNILNELVIQSKVEFNYK